MSDSVSSFLSLSRCVCIRQPLCLNVRTSGARPWRPILGPDLKAQCWQERMINLKNWFSKGVPQRCTCQSKIKGMPGAALLTHSTAEARSRVCWKQCCCNSCTFSSVEARLRVTQQTNIVSGKALAPSQIIWNVEFCPRILLKSLKNFTETLERQNCVSSKEPQANPQVSKSHVVLPMKSQQNGSEEQNLWQELWQTWTTLGLSRT